MGVQQDSGASRKVHDCDEARDACKARRPRADAARNRERLLAAAAEVFREQGLDAPVSEIAARAGVGRATLFRNFPTKQSLLIALLAQALRVGLANASALVAEDGEDPILLEYVRQFIVLQRSNRGLLEGVTSDTFMQDPEIASIHNATTPVIEAMIAHDQRLGVVRADVTAFDVLLCVRGASAIASSSLGADLATLERCLELFARAIAP